LLIVPILESYENSQVMRTCCDSYTRTCEFGAEMVISASGDPLLRAVNIKCGDRRMMRGLFRQERDSDFLATAGSIIAVLRGHAHGAARRSAVGMFEREGGVFDVPVTLVLLASSIEEGRIEDLL
jgi:hypothetical protein